jgi:Anthranilate phosphoribosyltransferase
MDKKWELWWEKILIRIQNQDNLTQEEVRKGWGYLWGEWKNIEKGFVTKKFLPEKLRMLMSLKSIDPLTVLIAPTFLTGIFAKGITVMEMKGFIQSFKDNDWFNGYQDVKPFSQNLIYTNGFGGDEIKTVNVSTPSIIMAAAAGANVLKMGSHSYFGASGAGNFTDNIGYKAITLPESVETAFIISRAAYINGESAADAKTQDIATFMSKVPNGMHIMKALFYPFRFHILCFDFFQAPFQQRGISVPDTELVGELVAELCSSTKKGMIVYGTDDKGLSLDEVSNVGMTKITLIEENKVKDTIYTTPEDWGVKHRNVEDITLSDFDNRLKITLESMVGKREDGFSDLLVINAAQYLFLNGMVDTFKKGTDLIKQSIANGSVREELLKFVESTNGNLAMIEKELANIK